jgi:hypothetical protein
MLKNLEVVISANDETLKRLKESYEALYKGLQVHYLTEEEPTFMEEIKGALKTALLGMLRSRKVMLAVIALIHTLAAYYLSVPAEVWGAIDALFLAVIAGIAHEDAAEKKAG